MSESGVYDINVNDYPRHRDETGDKELDEKIDHLDLIINNAVTVSPGCDKGFFETEKQITLHRSLLMKRRRSCENCLKIKDMI